MYLNIKYSRLQSWIGTGSAAGAVIIAAKLPLPGTARILLVGLILAVWGMESVSRRLRLRDGARLQRDGTWFWNDDPIPHRLQRANRLWLGFEIILTDPLSRQTRYLLARDAVDNQGYRELCRIVAQDRYRS